MRKSVFHYRDYKACLLDFLEKNKGRKRGTRAAMAAAARCQAAYISQVLNGSAQLSLEQAESVATRFCLMNESETEHFLLLVQHARAGTEELRRTLGKLIRKRAREAVELTRREEFPDVLSEADQIRYFSEWDYGAVHALLSIRDKRTPQAIADHLGIRPERVVELLGFLSSRGLAKKKGEEYRIGETRIMLDKGSQVATQNHINSRLRALSFLQNRNRAEDRFYSSVITLSEEDLETLRAMITDFIVEVNRVVAKTKPRKLMGFNIDFFSY